MIHLPKECNCGSGETREAQYDGRGIFLTYTCVKCHKEKMSRYRPEILEYYTQDDVDEPIEEEEGITVGIIGLTADDEENY